MTLLDALFGRFAWYRRWRGGTWRQQSGRDTTRIEGLRRLLE
jgi:hypothetical protein